MIDSDSLFILYLIAVRLGTIAAGIAAIRYGYKLFAAGVFKMDTNKSTTELSGRVGEYELKFKTGAPGAILGLFGAVIIVITIAAAPPELTRQKKETHEDKEAGKITSFEITEKMRGDDIALRQLLDEANKHKEKGQISEAIRAYQLAIRSIARPMNDLARLYMQADRLKDAKALAEVTVMMNPSDPDFAITLGEVRNSLEGKERK